MNKSYALVWNQALGCWNVANEWARRSGKAGRSKTVVAAAGISLLGLLGQTSAFALPNGGAVVAGDASLQTSADGKHMTIDQQSNKLITQWNEFNVGTDERVSFHQPGSDSVALNRVIGMNGSNIQGRIDANGKVFLVNPNGVVFGKSAQINVGGLVASSQNIADKDFLGGNYRFTGNSTAAVSNAGTLIAKEGGSVALLGAQVSNTGVIQAQMGSVALGAGKDFSVNFDGNGLLNLQVNSSVVDALAHNGGLLKADSGQVLMTARSADSLLKTVVSNQGVIEAKTLQNKAGRIILDGGDKGIIQVAGKQDATALGGQGNGGIVENRGARVEVQSGAQVNTLADKGATGTWTIHSNEVHVAEATSNNNNSVISDGNIVNSIIGNGSGNNVSLNGSESIANSQIGNGNNNNVSVTGSGNIIGSQIGNGSGNNVSLAGVGNIIGSQIGNNNGTGGNGSGSGNIIGSQIGNNNGTGTSWSGSGNIIGSQIGNNNGNNNNWSGSGNIIGQQIGNNNGNGVGFSAGNGNAHTASVRAVTSDAPTMNATTLEKNLITTNIALVSTSGNLSVDAPVFWNSSNTLGLTAERGSVQVNGTLSSTGSNAGLRLNAKQGGVQLNENVTLAGTDSKLELNYNAKNLSIKDGKKVTLSGSGASFQANGESYDVVQNLDQLRNIENNMAGRYVLGNAIGETGRFKSIGDGKAFTGTLEGLGNSISDLSIYGTTGYVGLFGSITGQVSNLNLERISASGDLSTHDNTLVGTLAGLNLGDIRNVKANDVRVTGAPQFNTLGGLVGINLGGTIENSSASGQVTGNRDTFAMGGLVGENITNTCGMAQISNSRADTIISGKMSGSTSYYGNSAGGLVGLNDGGSVTNSNSQGSVHLNGDNLNIGGLVGHNIGSISNASSSANVSGGKNSLLGGLIGFNRQGAVANSSASGQVAGNATQAIGGLIGKNLGNALANVSASGNVSDSNSRNVGGLVGESSGGAIVNATATNAVTGGANANVGGLVGYSRNTTVTNATASGNVIGAKDAIVGGLVGQQSGGRIVTSSAGGNVSGGQGSRVGGLVGTNGGQITTSSASATVSGGYYATLGGLVGLNTGSVMLSSASGKIDVSPANQQLYGGLMGMNFGQQYLNSVSGEARQVPLIGRNFRW